MEWIAVPHYSLSWVKLDVFDLMQIVAIIKIFSAKTDPEVAPSLNTGHSETTFLYLYLVNMLNWPIFSKI